MIKPSREEFEIKDDVIRHLPTGYSMTFHPGSRDTGVAELGQLGRPLEDGRYYEPDDVRQMVRELRSVQFAGRVFFPED